MIYRWIAVGDAAVAFDPLSSQGIMKSLDAGLKCGDALLEFLRDENSDILELYSNWYKKEFEEYSQNYYHFYGVEERFPDSEFWKRRQTEK